MTAAQYETNLEANLSGLLKRFKSGRYRALAVRRVHLEKPEASKTRPIGIPTLEDNSDFCSWERTIRLAAKSSSMWSRYQ